MADHASTLTPPEVQLPEGYTSRPATLDDLDAVYRVISDDALATSGAVDYRHIEIKTFWTGLDFDMTTDTLAVIAPDGQMVAYTDMEQTQHARLYFGVFVHPSVYGMGLGTSLLHAMEARCERHIPLADPTARITFNTGTNNMNTAAHEIFRCAGYHHIRSFQRMEMELPSELVAPVWPEEITLRTVSGEQDAPIVFETVEAAFSDHWGHTPGKLGEWKHWTFDQPDFDPTLYFLAFAGDELAGVALCERRDEQIGWVNQLGVRRGWRGKGLATALLRHAFSEFAKHGLTRAGLNVDAQNLTGAKRLYEGVGLQVARQFDAYQKEVRSGIEPSVQSLS